MTLRITGKVERVMLEVNGVRVIDLPIQSINITALPVFRKGKPVAYTDPDSGVMYASHILDVLDQGCAYVIAVNNEQRTVTRDTLSELVIEHIEVVQVAKLIRAMLKQSFPKTKFCVRSSKFTSGTAIDVRWAGRPQQVDVERLLAMFKSYDIQGGDGAGDPIYETPRHFVDGKLIVYDVKFLSIWQEKD